MRTNIPISTRFRFAKLSLVSLGLCCAWGCTNGASPDEQQDGGAGSDVRDVANDGGSTTGEGGTSGSDASTARAGGNSGGGADSRPLPKVYCWNRTLPATGNVTLTVSDKDHIPVRGPIMKAEVSFPTLRILLRDPAQPTLHTAITVFTDGFGSGPFETAKYKIARAYLDATSVIAAPGIVGRNFDGLWKTDESANGHGEILVTVQPDSVTISNFRLYLGPNSSGANGEVQVLLQDLQIVSPTMEKDVPCMFGIN